MTLGFREVLDKAELAARCPRNGRCPLPHGVIPPQEVTLAWGQCPLVLSLPCRHPRAFMLQLQAPLAGGHCPGLGPHDCSCLKTSPGAMQHVLLLSPSDLSRLETGLWGWGSNQSGQAILGHPLRNCRTRIPLFHACLAPSRAANRHRCLECLVRVPWQRPHNSGQLSPFPAHMTAQVRGPVRRRLSQDLASFHQQASRVGGTSRVQSGKEPVARGVGAKL